MSIDFTPPSLPLRVDANPQSIWKRCVDQLAQELPDQQFNTWIKPLTATLSEDLSHLTIWVGNRFKLDWIRAQYLQRISTLLTQIYGQPLKLELALTPKEAPIRSSPVSYFMESASIS